MQKTQVRKWINEKQQAVEMLINSVKQDTSVMAKHLAENGYPETELNALRAALLATEDELSNLAMSLCLTEDL